MNIRKLKQFFLQDIPILYKFIITNILLLGSTAIIYFLVFTQTAKLVTDNTISAENAMVTQTANTIEASLKNVITVMDSICSLPFLYRATGSVDPAAITADESALVGTEDFLSTVNAMIDHELITDVRIYFNPAFDVDTEPFITSRILQPLSAVKSSYWHGIFMGNSRYQSLFCPDFYLTNFEKNTCGKLAYIRRFSSPTVSFGKESAAYIAVYFSISEMESILHRNQNETKSVYYLINSRGNLAASSDATLSGLYYLDYAQIPEIIPSKDSFIETTILDIPLYMSYRDIADTDWRLVSVIPISEVSSSEQNLFQLYSTIYILVSVFLLLLVLILSNSVAYRISRITGFLNRNFNDIPEPIPADSGMDEISQLIQSYNHSVNRIHELLEEQAATADKLKGSEVRALQAQINPHFLYNMLDMINWLSISGNQPAVSEAVQSLSRFYKLTLSKENIMIPLRDELEHAALYVHLQNLRFSNSINFLIDVPDEILDCAIPKLVLQPIVENAILHGILETEQKKGDIIIMGWCQPNNQTGDDDIVLTISDNGVGIPPHILEQILTEKKQPEPAGEDSTSGKIHKGTNIAIYNTHYRLRLLYGADYGLHFNSRTGSSDGDHGTDVEVHLPKQLYTPVES